MTGRGSPTREAWGFFSTPKDEARGLHQPYAAPRGGFFFSDALVRPSHPPQRLRWLANVAQEGAAHATRVAEAVSFGDALERDATGLYRRPSGFQPQALDGLCGGKPYLGRKGAGEVARAHGDVVGKALDH
jgi:hypothetical protein